MSDFGRLQPSVQHHVVNTLGWSNLRPLQEAAISPILDGDHGLLLAPTAGGKTEAAFFPVLTRIAAEGWPPLSTLYLCPLRALLNDLLPRLERYASFTGHRVGLWHGDVGDAERRRLVTDPPDVLLTTPESLEAILISTRVDAGGFFQRLRTVIVDEVHSFASDDRGWHLLAVLARLEHLAHEELQRIGLSATVGNPEALLRWLTLGTTAPRKVINPPTGTGSQPDVMIDHVGSLTNAATVISRLHRGEKRLVFVDSRDGAEKLTHELRSRGTTTFVTHASLGREERRRAEAAFTEGSNCVIVATSTLELGVDVGDLDRVIQIDAPPTVAAFLQRLGRSGRRATLSNLLFLTRDDSSLWLACGLTRLWAKGVVEPVEPPPLPVHLLAHQLLALVLQEGAIGRHLWHDWLGDPCVLGADVAGFTDAVSDYLAAAGFLEDDGGMLSMGREAEARFGRRNFLELTSVFTAPPTFTVVAGRREIGHVHDLGLMAAIHARQGPPVLLLGGQGWRILDVDWRRRLVHVELTDLPGRTGYRGSGRPLEYGLSQSIGAVLAGEGPGTPLSQRAQTRLDETRAEFPGLQPGDATLLRHDPDGRTEWWTFAGQRANLELAAKLGPRCRGGGGVDDLSIALTDDSRKNDLTSALDRQARADELLELPEDATAGIKFADCIPDWLADRVARARLRDEPAVDSVLRRRIDEARLR